MTTSEHQLRAQSAGSQSVHAANLAVVEEHSASPEVQRLYQKFREHFVRPQVPGILQCFATHPPLLEHMMGLAKSMLFIDGSLGRQHKEMISTFVSASNHSAYCTDSHAFAFRTNGGTAAALDSVLACDLGSSSITPQQRTLLNFAKKITEDSQAITPSDIDVMRAADWTDLQIAETIHVTALFAAFNRVVNAFGLPSQNLLTMFEKEPTDVASR